jgi:hypothetical protein
VSWGMTFWWEYGGHWLKSALSDTRRCISYGASSGGRSIRATGA